MFEKYFLYFFGININHRLMQKTFLEHFPELKFTEKKYRYISTIDIDNAWAYRQKGIMRTVGASMRSILKMEFGNVAERLSVIAGKRKDPYDTYDLLKEIKERYKLENIYFFLLGDYAENDKNVSISSKKFQSLIKSIADYNEVGIHPSYSSANKPEQIRLEQ